MIDIGTVVLCEITGHHVCAQKKGASLTKLLSIPVFF